MERGGLPRTSSEAEIVRRLRNVARRAIVQSAVKALPFRAAVTILRLVGIASLLLAVLVATNRDAGAFCGGAAATVTSSHAPDRSEVVGLVHPLLRSGSTATLAFEADDYEQPDDDDPVLDIVIAPASWRASSPFVGYARARAATSHATSQGALRARSPRGPPA